MYARIRKTLGAVALVLSLAGAAGGNPGASDSRKYEIMEVRAEFDELYEKMQAAHFDLYARRSKREYDALYRAMRQSMREPMGQFEIQTEFQKFLAYGRIAHAGIDFPMKVFSAYREAGGTAMPLYIRVVDGAAYITENDSGLDTLSPGDQILTFNGQPVAALLDRLTAHLSTDNAYLAHTQLESLFPAYIWLEMGSVAGFDLSIRHVGEVRQIRVPARSRAEMQAAAARQPPSLDLDWNRRESRISDAGVAYLRPGPFYNNEAGATDPYDSASFSAFLDAAFRSYLQADCKALVIDLRDNPGGDNSFSDLMVNWFADKPYRFASAFQIKASQAAIDSNQKRIDAADAEGSASHRLASAYQERKLGEVFDFEIPLAYPRKDARFGGKVYLLINRNTYSNAVMVAALAQDYRFATILGEETADLASTYGAMEQFTLSRTGITVSFPKARILRTNGSTEARGVVPDIAIDTPVVQSQTDTVLTQALAIAVEGGDRKSGRPRPAARIRP